MATSKEMRAQIEALEKQLIDVRKQEIATAVDQVRALIREHGLTLDDIGKRTFAKAGGGGVKASAAGKQTVNPAKYRDPESGNTWTGKGRAPNWMAAAVKAGREAEFLIAGPAQAARKSAQAKKPDAKKPAAKKAAAKKARKPA